MTEIFADAICVWVVWIAVGIALLAGSLALASWSPAFAGIALAAIALAGVAWWQMS